MTSERAAFEKFFPAANANWLERSQQYSGPYHELWEGWQARGESDKSAEPLTGDFQALGDDELRALKPGDLVRHISEAMPHTYVVTGNYGGRVTAVCSVDLTNAPEWRAHPSADRASVQGELPPLPAPQPWKPAPMKCASCGLAKEFTYPTAAAAPIGYGYAQAAVQGCSRCGCTTFVGTANFSTVPTPTYTAEQMREYARAAILAIDTERGELR
jgi:hypothetical protein